jgi:hypothetical protein
MVGQYSHMWEHAGGSPKATTPEPTCLPPWLSPTPHPAAPVRAAVLGASVVAYMGIMKVNLTGPGLTETVKTLWRKPQPAAAPAAN